LLLLYSYLGIRVTSLLGTIAALFFYSVGR
jgi:hypothetical protein